MKATIRDTATLRTVQPLELVAYLRARGWMETQQAPHASYWTKEVGTSNYEVLLPFERDATGYPQRISELLCELELEENRSQIEIFEDLSFASADVIRPRLPTANEDGTISLEDGKAAYEHARALMLAAACAEIEKREVFAKRKPEQAMRFLQQAKFGVPKRGSYMMTIISPVPPRIIVENALLDVPAAEPYERRTVTLLARALETVTRAGRLVASTGDFAPMKAAVATGVSANLCDALIALHHCSGERGVDFQFSWAPSRGRPDAAPSAVSIKPDLIPILVETSRVLRETGVQTDVRVLGTVHKLEHAEGTKGIVTIYGTVDGVTRSVNVELDGDDHAMAVRSYQQRSPLHLAGELVKKGRTWYLVQPRNVKLLTEDQLETAATVEQGSLHEDWI